MVDFTTLTVPELPTTPQIPVAQGSRNGWMTALIVVLAIGMIVCGILMHCGHKSVVYR